MKPGHLVRALLRTRPSALPETPDLEVVVPAARAPEGRLARFRALTSYPDNGYLPLTWPHAQAFAAHMQNLLSPRFPLPLPGLVNIALHISQRRPIGAGEPLKLQARVGAFRETEKGYHFDLETRCWVRDELVWTGAAAMLSRRPGRSPTAAAGRPDAATGAPALSDPRAVSRVFLVPARVAREFAFVSGDLNPIHLSVPSARLLGFPGVVAHGLWSATRMAGCLPDWLTRPALEFRCAFKLPLVLPASITLRTWAEDDNRLELRLVDAAGDRPHVIGSLAATPGGEAVRLVRR